MSRVKLPAAITPLPELTGAACAGRSDLFDLRPVHSDDDDRAYCEALALCARCPVLGACRAWFASLPNAKRPDGCHRWARTQTERGGAAQALLRDARL
jgi:hypothetical protein